jgi:hypothetical protein
VVGAGAERYRLKKGGDGMGGGILCV